jgi:hypothetical protein
MHGDGDVVAEALIGRFGGSCFLGPGEGGFFLMKRFVKVAGDAEGVAFPGSNEADGAPSFDEVGALFEEALVESFEFIEIGEGLGGLLAVEGGAF